MKKIISIILTAVFCLLLYGCGEDNFDKTLAFENMSKYFTDNFTSEDYYIQISKTQAESHVLTEVSKLGDDCAFFVYDVTGELKFFRDGKLKNISPETYYTIDEKDADWNDFTYAKTAETYRNVLKKLCSSESLAIKEIKAEKNDNKDFPYKISVIIDLDKTDAKTLFGSGGNFGSLSVKFLCSENGENFDDISLNVQYDYNSEIYVIAAYFGEPDLPDENGDNGQRPDDIQEIFEDYSEDMQKSFEQYMESVQANY